MTAPQKPVALKGAPAAKPEPKKKVEVSFTTVGPKRPKETEKQYLRRKEREVETCLMELLACERLAIGDSEEEVKKLFPGEHLPSPTYIAVKALLATNKTLLRKQQINTPWWKVW